MLVCCCDVSPVHDHLVIQVPRSQTQCKYVAWVNCKTIVKNLHLYQEKICKYEILTLLIYQKKIPKY